ncbi:MAG: FAD-dependent oxidoreductase [Deltaproteobacteria bacterium]|nr:FAD-dependent oxidoreductase [Deltaproteobacteria bacterium]
MGNIDQAKTEVIGTDLLILGGGIAGCFAAIKGRELKLDVTLVDKGNVGRSGLSPMMSGVLSYFDPKEDNHDDWYRECVEASEWLSDQEMLDGMINQTTECVNHLIDWGARFQTENGKLIRKPMVGHIHGRNAMMTHGGLQLMAILRGEVLRRGARVLERVMATDLLSSDGELPTKGRITGAVGFNVRNGKFFVIRAKATVLATGMTSVVLLRSPANGLSGDGRAMAFRAGCEMRNIDLSQYSPHPAGFNCAPGLNIVAGEGSILVNNKGERFLKKWDQIRMERATRVVICKAITTEELEKRGPAYFDATHLDESSHEKFEKCIPIVVRTLELGGLSFRKDKIPYAPDLVNLEAGGIRTNREKATTVPGLYAIGDASDHGEMGVTELITPGIASAIEGYRAAEAAAGFAGGIEEPAVNKEQVKVFKEQVFAPLARKSGLGHLEVKQHCKNILASGLLGPAKNEKGLKEAIGMAKVIRDLEIPRLKAHNYHELAASIGLANGLTFLELYGHCSLVRKESRGSHWRTDFPEKDNMNWLKWVIARKEGTGIKTWAEQVPFEKYPLKPDF